MTLAPTGSQYFWACRSSARDVSHSLVRSAKLLPTIMARKVKKDAVSATNLMHGVRTKAPSCKHQRQHVSKCEHNLLLLIWLNKGAKVPKQAPEPCAKTALMPSFLTRHSQHPRQFRIRGCDLAIKQTAPTPEFLILPVLHHQKCRSSPEHILQCNFRSYACSAVFFSYSDKTDLTSCHFKN